MTVCTQAIFIPILSCLLLSHFEEPKVTEDEEPPTEQDKRKKLVSFRCYSVIELIRKFTHPRQNSLPLDLVHLLFLNSSHESKERKGSGDKLCSHIYASAFLLSLRCCRSKYNLITEHCKEGFLKNAGG